MSRWSRWKAVPTPDPVAFAAFAEQWRRVGMPGEPRDEGTEGASVMPGGWGVRLYYVPAVAVEILQGLPGGDVADEEAHRRILRALDDDELHRAALVLNVPTLCPLCDGPLLEDDGERFRCSSCGGTLLRAGFRWEPAPTTERDIRIEKVAAGYERLFSDIAEEPVEVDRSFLGTREPRLHATFTTRAGADLIVLCTRRFRGLALRKQRGRHVVLEMATAGQRRR